MSINKKKGWNVVKQDERYNVTDNDTTDGYDNGDGTVYGYCAYSLLTQSKFETLVNIHFQ